MEGESDVGAALAGTPYRFVRVLGRGGMGVVVEAVHEALGAQVAVKLFGDGLEDRPDLFERFRIEAQALARLGHPGLVRVTDLGQTPTGRRYYVMEKLEGRTLGDELEARGALPPAEAVALALELLGALGAAHTAGIVHRDVKPANVFLATQADGARRVKLLDFGIAKVLEGAATRSNAPAPSAFRTELGSMLGTPRWISPEQITGDAVSPATDVYAVGLVLYRALAGRHPFADQKGRELLEAHLHTTPPPPSAWAPGVPAALDAVVMLALSKRPEHRPPDARAFAAKLATTGDTSAAPALPVATPTFAPPAAPTLVAPASSIPPTLTLPAPGSVSAPAAGPAAPAAAAARHPIVGAGLVLVGLVDLVWRGNSAVRSGLAFASPDTWGERLAHASPADAATLRDLMLRVAPSQLLRSLALLGASLFGAWLGVRLLAGGRGLATTARAWSIATVAAALAALVLDLFFKLPASVEYARLVPSTMASGASGAFVAHSATVLLAGFSLAQTIAYVAWAVVVRRVVR